MTLKEFLVFLYCVFSYLCPFLQSYKSTSMIDIKFLVKNPDVVRENIKKKFQDSKLPLVDEAINLYTQYCECQQRADDLRSQRNSISKEIGILFKNKEVEKANEMKKLVEANAQELEQLGKQQTSLMEQLTKVMYSIPNIIAPEVPVGKDDTFNVEKERFGEPIVPDFEVPYHADIMAKALLIAQRTIDTKQQRIQMLEGEKNLLEQENKILQPKAQYTDDVLQSNETYTFTQLAKELNFRNVQGFITKLRDSHVIFKQSGQWMLTAKYSGNGYTKARTAQFFHSDGSIGTSTSTVWTEKGRMFLHQWCGKLARA